jgi:hypothetical protein
MKAARLGVVFAVAWCMQMGTAHAAEDWLDKLSGPGRFWGLSLPYRFVCFSRASAQSDFRTFALPPAGQPLTAEARALAGEAEKTYVTWMSPIEQAAGVFPSRHRSEPVPPSARDATTLPAYRVDEARYDCSIDQRVHSYFSLSPGIYWSTRNRLFPDDPKNGKYRVWILHADLEYVYRLNRYFDINAGIGLNRFSGDVFSSFSRVSLAPIGIHFAPFGKRDDQLARSLRLGVGITSFVGGFDASDFCNVDPVTCAGVRANFTSEKERLFKYFIDLDPVLLRRLFGKDVN